jgi:hypothetical protein
LIKYCNVAKEGEIVSIFAELETENIRAYPHNKIMANINEISKDFKE